MVVVVVVKVLEHLLDELVHLVDERLLSLRFRVLQEHAHLLHVLLDHGREGLLVQSSLVSVLYQAVRDASRQHLLVVLDDIQNLLQLGILSILLGNHGSLHGVPTQSQNKTTHYRRSVSVWGRESETSSQHPNWSKYTIMVRIGQ